MLEGEIRLTPSERTELRDRMRSRTLPAEDVRRARLIVLLAQGKSYLAIRHILGCNPNYPGFPLSKWANDVLETCKAIDRRGFGRDQGGAEVERRWVRRKIGPFSSRSI